MPENYLKILIKVCQVEADPDAISLFARGDAATCVRVSLFCGRRVIVKAKSRAFMDFEDDVNIVLQLPLTVEDYGQIILHNASRSNSGEEHSIDGDSQPENFIRLEMVSLYEDSTAVAGANVSELGEVKAIKFLDDLEGITLPSSEPEHPREYKLCRRGKTQAVLIMKMWTELSTAFLAHEAALRVVGKNSELCCSSSNNDKHNNDDGNNKAARSQSPNSKISGHDEVKLEKIARHLGIDPIDDPNLLWIAREAMETPPPPFWVKVELGDGELYQNMRNGATSLTNPALKYFQQLTEKERQRVGDPIPKLVSTSGINDGERNANKKLNIKDSINTSKIEEPRGANSWIRLGNSESGQYYYNFDKKEKVTRHSELPSKAQILDTLPSLVEPHKVNGAGKTGDGPNAMIVRTLTFYTWWKEGTSDGMKRFTTKIMYDLGTQNFIISFEDSHDTVTLAEVRGRNGPLNQWDLHVTGVIELLGRKITLQQCDESTLRWLDYRARKLIKLRLALKTELMKFDKRVKIRECVRSSNTRNPIYCTNS